MKKKSFSADLSLEQINAAQIESIKFVLCGLLSTQFNDEQIDKLKVTIVDMIDSFDAFNKDDPKVYWNEMRPWVVQTVNVMLPGCLDSKD